MKAAPDPPPRLGCQWLFSLLLGSAFYAVYQGTVHFSDWCYLAVATAVAAGISALLIPLNKMLLRQLAAHEAQWPALGRWAGLLGSTLGLFGLANVLVWPLRTWLGPGSTWPWGVAAVLVAGTMHLGKGLRPACPGGLSAVPGCFPAPGRPASRHSSSFASCGGRGSRPPRRGSGHRGGRGQSPGLLLRRCTRPSDGA